MFISHFKSLSGKARHQGLLTHDQEGSFTAEMGKRLPQRSPAPLAMPLASVLVTICLLLSMVQNAIKAHKIDSLVGGNRKRMTPPSSLIKLRGFRLSAGHFTLSHYAELFSETENDALSAIESSLSLGIASSILSSYGDTHRASYAKIQKESQDPRSRKSSLGNAPRLRPWHRRHALWE